MPKLIESIMTETAKTKFRSLNLTLPSVVASGPPASPGQFLLQGGSSSPAAGGALTPKFSAVTTLSGVRVGVTPTIAPSISTQISVRPIATPQQVPPALFKAASNDKADVDFQTQVSTEYTNYIAAISHAIATAHDSWRMSAHLQGVVIMAINASGGSVVGPPLSPMIVAGAGSPQAVWGSAQKFTQAIADGLDSCWTDWQATVKVPNLPWYPSFAAFPAPSAPPTPNIPSPLSALSWPSAMFAADYINNVIGPKLSQAGPYSGQVFQSIAAGFATAVSMWAQTQMVTNVLGMGPVPNFAPPYVPVGSVVGGTIVSAGSHFSA